MDIIQRYKLLNSSYDKLLIYHLGIDAGFFTEYTYMLNAMLFCLQHKIQFKLYSDDANFRYEKGWSDFFIPFCEEIHDSFHSSYNKHRLPSWTKILKRFDWKVGKWKLKCIVLNFIGDILAWKTYQKHVLLNHHVRFDSKQHFYIPELGIDGDYFHAFKVMVDITWRLNVETENEVRLLTGKLKLPKDYVGCQVRGGDKIIETELLSPDIYLKELSSLTSLTDVFVLTDDYRIFKYLQLKSSNYQWYTFCIPNEEGYVNNTFSQQYGEKKMRQMVRFIASMHILLHSTIFIGSITTAPSLFLLKFFYPNHYPIDCTKVMFGEIAGLSMNERCKIAEEYSQKHMS